MPSYVLEIEAFGVYASDVPSLEIWADGVLDSTHSVMMSGTTILLTINYSGALPSSLEFLFDDASSESGRAIEIQSVKINNRYVNTGNYLSSDSLVKNASATVDVTNSSFLFNSSEPDSSEFTPVTLVLTLGNDTLRRFDGGDYILDGLAGRESIYLGSGNDKVNGNDGNDLLRGGGGIDLLYGEDGDDRLYGEGGNDEMYGNSGHDRINGHAGNDVITGGEGNDKIGGGTGTDYLFGDEGDDQIVGADGDDTIDGGDDNDLIYGGSGNDVLDGGNGDDIVAGNIGHDIIKGNSGNDVLLGQAGNDVINGGEGVDSLHGEDGNDTIDGGLGRDVAYGGAGDDIIYGGHVDRDTLYGEDGNDTLYAGDSDRDFLFGGDGTDTLYSGSSATIDSLVTDILNDNAGVSYSADTNSFYKYVSTSADWTSANTAANSATLVGLSGVNGHLATITSAAENTFVGTVVGANDAWIGANDAGTEGEWGWTSGPESGQQFSNALGLSVNGMYANWALLEPVDISGIEDYAVRRANGEWAANEDTLLNSGYVIEWDADSLLNDVEKTTLNGENDSDTLYGSDGIEMFIFDNTTGVDTVHDFDAAGRDWLDISDIITGYDPLADDLNDFVALTESAGNTTVSVDSDGAANGSNYTDIAVLNGVTGLDLYQMVHADNLVIS